jgi:superfamily II DNA helicase RecQ
MRRLKSWKEGREEGRKIHGSYWKYMKSPFWRDKCKEFKEDYDEKCEWCGKETKDPEVHHKNYMVLYYEQRKDVNLICKKCHRDHHDGNENFSRDKIDNSSEEENVSEFLFSELKSWRLRKARERERAIGRRFPAYCIFKNRSLKELSIKKPLTKKELFKIYGFGNSKVEFYGDEILEIIKKMQNTYKP